MSLSYLTVDDKEEMQGIVINLIFYKQERVYAEVWPIILQRLTRPFHGVYENQHRYGYLYQISLKNHIPRYLLRFRSPDQYAE